MKIVSIPSDVKKITVAEVFRLMLDQVSDGQIRVTIGSDTNIVSREGLVPVGELQKQFLKFCKLQNVMPTNPLTPWDFDYTGEDHQNNRYEISVNDFRAFAQPFGFEVSFSDPSGKKVINLAMAKDVDASDSEWDADLLDAQLKLPAPQDGIVSSKSDKSSKRSRSLFKVVEDVALGGPLLPGPRISIAKRDFSMDENTCELDWGDELLSPDAPGEFKLGSSGKLSRRGVNSRNSSRGAASPFLKKTTQLREIDSDHHELVVDSYTPAKSAAASDQDKGLANLFDAVTVAQLERMFPDQGKNGKSKWRGWAERAARNGLSDAAKDGRACFNPYQAAIWWLKQGPENWDLARCYRVLANNLPERSIDSKSLLTGNFE